MSYTVSDKLYDFFEGSEVQDLTYEQIHAVLKCFKLEDDPRTKYVKIIVDGKERDW